MSTEEAKKELENHPQSEAFMALLKRAGIRTGILTSIATTALTIGGILIVIGIYKNEVNHNTADIQMLKNESITIANRVIINESNIARLQVGQQALTENQERIFKSFERLYTFRSKQ